MPLALLGLLPSRVFPSQRSRHVSRRSQPSCRFNVVRRSARRRPTSGPGSSCESVSRCRGLTLHRARSSPGLCLLFRALLYPCGAGARRLLRTRLPPPVDFLALTCHQPQADDASCARRSFGVLLAQVADPVVLTTGPTLLRFVTSSPFSKVWDCAWPWLIVSPQVPSHVTALREPSSGLLQLLPEPLEK
jgi:hypothetical protein